MASDIKKIDAKGRFFLPSKLKARFEDGLVVTTSLDRGYLSAYTVEHFEDIKAQFAEMDTTDGNLRKVIRWIVGESLEVNVDSQGRVAVTSELWKKIGARPGEEIYVIDLGTKLEICRREFYEADEVDFDALSQISGKYSVKGL